MNIKKNIKRIVKFFNSKEKIVSTNLSNIDELLNGKNAIITGGSGGIGLAIAERFLSAGCNVIITGTNKEKLIRCSSHLNSDKLQNMVLDLNNVSEIKRNVEQAIELFPCNKIDILVNCAGVNLQKGFFETREKDFDNTLDVNVKGTFFICQAVAEYMIKNKIKGHILNISSSSALRPAWSPYEISKWALKGMTLGLADALIPYGIVVNAIAPGPTATPMLGVDASGDIDLSTSPIGRYITPDEIANLALVLVSSLGDIVIGDTLYATGGSGVISLHR